MNNNHLTPEIFNTQADNLSKLAALFPAAVKDGQLDITALREELGDFEEVGAERYELTWAGKQAAKKLSQTDVPGRTLKYVPEDSKDADTTQNLYIEGDNLEVLKLLRQNYYGAVKMIYIDPPYNTGRNLIYRNDFSVSEMEYLEETGELDENGGKMSLNLQTSGRFHSNWLSMIYARLRVARDLLTKDGVLVCAIDYNEQATLMLVLQEVFPENSYEHICVTLIHNPRGIQGTNFSYTHEYAIFVYPKGDQMIYDRAINVENVDWSQFRNWGGESERHDAKNCFYPVIIQNGKILGFGDVCNDNEHPAQTEQHGDKFYVYPIDRNGIERKWRYARQSVEAIASMLKARKTDAGYEIEIGKTFGTHKTVWTDTKYDANEYGTKIVNDLVPGGGFTFPKSLYTVYDSIYAGAKGDKDAIIIDFFSGSATTAHAIMQLNADDNGNRKFIMVQYPEVTNNADFPVICEIGKERIRRAGDKIKTEIEAANEQVKLGEKPKQIPDIGFRVFRTADTNIRWTHEAVLGQMEVDVNMLSDKDRLDFMPGYTDIDVVYEVLLRQRDIPLSTKVEKLGIGTRTYLFANAYVVCLDDTITAPLVEALAAVEPTPIKYVFRDSAFDDNISLKDETIRRLGAYIARNSGGQKKAYTVEFI